MERTTGATELRQGLTDILQAVRERGDTYVIETFGRPQAAIINLDEYGEFRRYRQERDAFFEWLDEAAAANAQHNRGLTDEDVLQIIDDARREVAAEAACHVAHRP